MHRLVCGKTNHTYKDIIDLNTSLTHDLQSIKRELKFIKKQHSQLQSDSIQRYFEVTRRADNNFMFLTLAIIVTMTLIIVLFK